MNAGREMDALVAEKVMGWIGPITWIDDEEGRDPYMFPPGLIASSPDNDRIVPNYSTDIAAAWLVVEHIRKERAIHLYHGYSDTALWVCQVDEPPSRRISDARAETMPMAVCLAALKFMGVNVE